MILICVYHANRSSNFRAPMYVCICRAVTDTAIRRAVEEEGVRTLRELSRETGAGTQCGSCVATARAILDEALAAQAPPRALAQLRVVAVT